MGIVQHEAVVVKDEKDESIPLSIDRDVTGSPHLTTISGCLKLQLIFPQLLMTCFEILMDYCLHDHIFGVWLAFMTVCRIPWSCDHNVG